MTILLTHHLDGTVGQAVNAAAEGYHNSAGAGAVYQSGGVSGTCARFTGDNGAAELFDTAADTTVAPYQGFYLRLIAAPAASGCRIMAVYTAGSVASAYVSINTNRTLSIGSPWSNVATTTTALTLNTWYRVERHVDLAGSTQELRLFSPADSTTPIETLTGACRNNGATSIAILSTGVLGANAAGLVFDVDEVAVANDWPNLATPTGPTVRGVIVGGVEVAATLRGVISGGVEVGATVKQVTSSTTAPTVVEFSDFDTSRSAGLDYFNSGQSLVGTGVDQTIYQMTPNTSTYGPYVAGLTSGQTNQCALIKIGGADGGNVQSGLEVADLTVQGTDQGHIYNGLMVGYSDGANVHDIKIADIPGDDIAPPGETFSLNMWHANNATVSNMTIDGGNIAATLGGTNNCENVTFTNCTFVDSGAAMPFACWQSKNITFDGCTFLGAQRGINIENPYGGYHTFKNCTFGKYVKPWQIVCQAGVWVTPDANTTSTVLTIEDPVWDFATLGPFVVKHMLTSTYPQNRQLDSDIHLIVGGVDVTSDSTKFQFTTAG